MGMNSGSLVAFLVAVSFAAGLNVYATVAVLGLLARLHWFTLPTGLGALGETWIVATAATLFFVELLADKVPYFDVVWNALHTFVRLPVAALLAYHASAALSPEMKVAVTAAATLVAAVAHSSKTVARVVVTPSPEPVSNTLLSGAEDLVAVGLTWAATRHPYIAGSVAALSLIALALFVRLVVRRLRAQKLTLQNSFRHWKDRLAAKTS